MRGLVATVRALVTCGVLVLGACGDDEERAPTDDAPADETTAPDEDDDVAVGTFPTRAPEVTGRIAVEEGVVRLVEPSDSYYAEMVLVSSSGDDDVLVVDEGGNDLSLDQLEDGLHVDVWVGDVCAESYPVQCDVEALRIDLSS